MISPATKPLEADTANIADRAADSANQAIRSTQGVANAAFDRMSDGVDSARDRASPAIDRLASKAEAARQRGMEAMQNSAAQLRESAYRAQNQTVGYVRDEPLKALLIAAAAGAVLMAVVGFLSRPRRIDGPV
jgi:ElaB/YqjD/DUF883 family membrane-anchored ribosome-binding protein